MSEMDFLHMIKINNYLIMVKLINQLVLNKINIVNMDICLNLYHDLYYFSIDTSIDTSLIRYQTRQI